MSGLVTCGWCLQVVAADGVHSCFDAKKVADHRAAERALIEAAKAEVMWCLANPHDHDSKYWPPMVDAAYALWALEAP
jgi:hypothetical protein